MSSYIREADGLMQTTTQLDIEATPDAIFAYLLEPKNLLKWQTLLSSAENVTGGEVSAGTEFAMQMDIGKEVPQAESILKTTKIDMRGTVTEYEPAKHLRIAGESDFNRFSFDYHLSHQDGITRLTQQSSLDFKHPLLRALEPLFRGWLQQRGEQDLRQLKTLLETGE